MLPWRSPPQNKKAHVSLNSPTKKKQTLSCALSGKRKRDGVFSFPSHTQLRWGLLLLCTKLSKKHSRRKAAK